MRYKIIVEHLLILMIYILLNVLLYIFCTFEKQQKLYIFSFLFLLLLKYKKCGRDYASIYISLILANSKLLLYIAF